MISSVRRILEKDYWLGYVDKKTVVRSWHHQYVWFAIVGVGCLFFDTAMLVFLVQAVKLPLLPATALSFIAATSVNYWLNVQFVFEGGKYRKSGEILFFFVVSVAAFFLTLFLMHWFVEVVHMWYVGAKVITVFLVSVMTFVGRKLLIFKS